MELTAEQKFLKAIAAIYSGRNTPHNLIFDAVDKFERYIALLEQKDQSEEKVDQFRDVKEKVDQFTDVSKKVEPEPAWKPTWKPEVGKLYKRDCGTIYEHMGMIGKYALFRALDGSESKAYPSNNIPLTSIAELEGLEAGDEVWSVGKNGCGEDIIAKWDIEDDDVYDALLIVRNNKFFTVHRDGSMVVVGNGRQLFWRTADRAERFGKR